MSSVSFATRGGTIRSPPTASNTTAWLASGKGWLEIPPDEAAAYMGERLGIEPAREGDQNAYISRRARRIAERIFPLPGRGHGLLRHFFSEFFDWNELPLFKNFLRIDVRGSELTICCFAATGCLDHEKNPPVEDEVKISLEPPRPGSVGEGERQERPEEGANHKGQVLQ